MEIKFSSLPVSIARFPQPDRIVRILRTALQAADPRIAVQNHLELRGHTLIACGIEYAMDKYDHVFLIAIGKASIGMAQGVVDRVGDYLTGGVVVTKHVVSQPAAGLERIEILQGEHPLPGKGSLEAGKRVEDWLQKAGRNDLVICAISGGGSALLTRPVEDVSLTDVQTLTSALLACGATIQETNTLRKHLDQMKGGGIVKAAEPAQMLTLILSDVVGSPLDTIASGPTVPDPSTFQEALEILRRHQLWENTPGSIQRHLIKGENGLVPETLKPGNSVFERVQNLIVGSNH
ncbi:MAG: glycerate-2-kinase family protein, partial [Anaerolineaceae bacterium]|nr:glycerate-2-kinase family protein [Anaerolineaceae bacterium]